jgi:hypothetical protein
MDQYVRKGMEGAAQLVQRREKKDGGDDWKLGHEINVENYDIRPVAVNVIKARGLKLGHPSGKYTTESSKTWNCAALVLPERKTAFCFCCGAIVPLHNGSPHNMTRHLTSISNAGHCKQYFENGGRMPLAMLNPVVTHADVTAQLLHWLFARQCPFKIVEDPEFAQLFHLLSPAYTLPSRTQIRRKL